MRGKVFYILAIAAALTLAGCGEDDENDSGSNSNGSQNAKIVSHLASKPDPKIDNNLSGTKGAEITFEDIESNNIKLVAFGAGYIEGNYSTITKTIYDMQNIEDLSVKEYFFDITTNDGEFTQYTPNVPTHIFTDGEWKPVKTGKKYELSDDGKTLYISLALNGDGGNILVKNITLQSNYNYQSGDKANIEVAKQKRKFTAELTGSEKRYELNATNENVVFIQSGLGYGELESFIENRRCKPKPENIAANTFNYYVALFFDRNETIVASRYNETEDCDQNAKEPVSTYKIVEATQTNPRMVVLNFYDEQTRKNFDLGDEYAQTVFVSTNIDGSIDTREATMLTNKPKIVNIYNESMATTMQELLKGEFDKITIENKLKYIGIPNLGNETELRFSDLDGYFLSSPIPLSRSGNVSGSRNIYILKSGSNEPLKICDFYEEFRNGSCSGDFTSYEANASSGSIDLNKISTIPADLP